MEGGTPARDGTILRAGAFYPPHAIFKPMPTPSHIETTWQELANRARAHDANGDLLPLADGRETTEKLRHLCLQLAEGCCPAGENHPHCPFHLLSKLSPCSVRHLIETMPEADLRELFVMELLCRKLACKAAG